MEESVKMTGENRQAHILESLKTATSPIKGAEFSKETNVSRQVIVQDVSILKAKGEPILATNQGYIYMKDEAKVMKETRTIVCKHIPEQTIEELNTIVDFGVTVKNVCVEHAVYGEITAIVNVSNRQEVLEFVEHMKKTNANLLSELTEGIHLHTIEADSMSQLDAACEALKAIGILIEND